MVCDQDEKAKNPVCGSDHGTYDSECDLRRAACAKREDIQVLERKPCGEKFKVFKIIFFPEEFVGNPRYSIGFIF